MQNDAVRRTLAAATLVALLGGLRVASAEVAEPALGGGQYGHFTEKAAEGPFMRVACATHFGGPGSEEFLSAGELRDGTVVAFGNAWGPDAPGRAIAVVIGSGSHSGKPQSFQDKEGNLRPDPQSVDRAGLIVFYNRRDDRLEAGRMIRFDWGVATISTGHVSSDGADLIVAGTCRAHFDTFRSVVKSYKSVSRPPVPVAEDATRKKAKPTAVASDAYVARISPDGQIRWLVVLERSGPAPDEVFLDGAGNIYLDAGGLFRISADGSDAVMIDQRTGSGQAGWRGVDTDGHLFFGGDRNTHTGHQPWRQPYLYELDQKGNKLRSLWEFNPHECACGSGGNGLCSDSSVRTMAFGKNGSWVLGGKSDGGNSVFVCKADDWHKPVPEVGMGMSSAGAHVLNLTHIMRFDPKTGTTLSHLTWAAYVPSFFGDDSDKRARKDRGRPNTAVISQIAMLDNGAIAFVGGAATGLAQTPNAFWKDPMLPNSHGGEFVTVLRPDQSNVMFSSYLPGIAGARLTTCHNGVLVTGRSSGSDNWVKPTKAPSVNADQDFAGGTDGFLLLLRTPR